MTFPQLFTDIGEFGIPQWSLTRSINSKFDKNKPSLHPVNLKKGKNIGFNIDEQESENVEWIWP